MKITFKDNLDPRSNLEDLKDGSTFILNDGSQFNSYLYMKIRVACAGLNAHYCNNQITVVNLKSGTVRLLHGQTKITRMKTETIAQTFDKRFCGKNREY